MDAGVIRRTDHIALGAYHDALVISTWLVAPVRPAWKSAAHTRLSCGADTLQFINYKANPNTRDEIAGTVDMQRYLQWLNDHGYNIHMTLR
jgi:hypothetical protein